MKYYKAKITDVITRTNDKCGEYIAVKFNYQDEEENENTAYKNFFINHSNAELAKKARQILYRMRSYLVNTPQNEDNSVLIGKQAFITLNITDRYKNVNDVYFLAEEKKK